MKLSERQYERIARHLDGEPIDLTHDEQVTVTEIRQAEAMLQAMPEVRLPRRAMDRAHRRMMAELIRPRRRLVQVIWPAAAAAAAILITAAAIWLRPSRSIPPPVDAVISTDILDEIYSHDDDNIDLELIADELERLEADIVVSKSAAPIEAKLDALQQSLDTFWLTNSDYLSEEG